MHSIKVSEMKLRMIAPTFSLWFSFRVETKQRKKRGMASSSSADVMRRVLQAPTAPVRLLIGIGGLLQQPTPGSLGACVLRYVLERCRPAPSDIHDSQQASQRSHSRDANGFNRRKSYELRRGTFAYQHKRTVSCETWDTAPFLDFDAVWCDRLLLGQPQQRSAVLIPHGSAPFNGVSVERVLSAFPSLLMDRGGGQQRTASRVLLVCSTPAQKAGHLSMGLLGDDSMLSALRAHQKTAPSSLHSDVACCIDALDRVTQGDAVNASILWIGVGGDEPCNVPWRSLHQRQMLEQRVFPQSAVASALWCSNPSKACEFVRDEKWISWGDTGSPSEQRDAVLTALLQSMLSTRDSNVLKAYATGTPLSARMSDRSVWYEADKLLQRHNKNNAV